MARMQQPQRAAQRSPGACSQKISPRTPRTGSCGPRAGAAHVEHPVETLRLGVHTQRRPHAVDGRPQCQRTPCAPRASACIACTV
jgi:hypothetical protein